MSIADLLYVKKYPTTNKNYVGIEIECLVPRRFRDKLLPDKLISAGLQWNVSLGYDGSVDDNTWEPKYNKYYDCINYGTKPIGTELRILVEETELFSVLDKVCSILKQCEAYVNTTCGLHVHLDMRNRDHDVVYTNLYKLQTTMLKSQPQHRKKNRFCTRVKSLKEKTKNRYKTINKQSYNTMRTLEVRLHEGTINFDDIKKWTEFLISIADMKTIIKNSVRDIKRLPLSIDVKEHLDARIKKYS